MLRWTDALPENQMHSPGCLYQELSAIETTKTPWIELCLGATSILVRWQQSDLHKPEVIAERMTLLRSIENTLAVKLSETSHQTRSHHQHRILDVPIIYGSKSADPFVKEDIKNLSKILRLSEEEIIILHSSAIYTVAFFGFSPGFPYLSGLPDTLQIPRKSRPLPRIPAGSVAIATNYCSIYPSATPGGWHLLGLTRFKTIHADAGHVTLELRAGDQIKFIPE